MRDAGFQSALAAHHIALDLNVDGGRSIPNYVPHSGCVCTNGLTAASGDRALIARDDAVVIELGTNPPQDTSLMQTLLSRIRAANAHAPVFWVSLGSTGMSYSGYSTAELAARNQLILHNAGPLHYTVIDWTKAVFGSDQVSGNDRSGYVSSDGIHPNTTGTRALINLVSGSLH